MRLIDAELLKEKFSASINTGYDTFDRDAICECIDFTPTAEQSPWIPITEGMPKEKDSLYAKAYGTNKWMPGMFRKISNNVNVTYEYENGEIRTGTAYTVDGKWKNENGIIKKKVTAWMPLPEPYKPESVKQ